MQKSTPRSLPRKPLELSSKSPFLRAYISGGGESNQSQFLDKEMIQLYDENCVRQQVSEMVRPLLQTARENVALANQQIRAVGELEEKLEVVARPIQKLQREVEEFSKVYKRLAELEEKMKIDSTLQSQRFERLQDSLRSQEELMQSCFSSCQKVEGRVGDVEQLMQRQYADVIAFKEVLHLEVEELEQKFEEGLSRYAGEIEEQKKESMRHEVKFKQNRELLNQYSDTLSSLQVELEKKKQELDSFIQDDFQLAKRRTQALDDRLRQMQINYSDLFTQFTITQVKIDPAFEKLKSVETFVDKYLPFLIHLRVAEAIQEVTTNKQKATFLQFDRKKISELYQFSLDRSDQQSQGGPPANLLRHFNRRLGCFLSFLAAQEQGSVRFEYGKEWTVDMPEEQLEYLDKGYQIVLDQKLARLQPYLKQMSGTPDANSNLGSKRQSVVAAGESPQLLNKSLQARGGKKIEVTISSEMEDPEERRIRDEKKSAYFSQFKQPTLLSQIQIESQRDSLRNQLLAEYSSKPKVVYFFKKVQKVFRVPRRQRRRSSKGTLSQKMRVLQGLTQEELDLYAKSLYRPEEGEQQLEVSSDSKSESQSVEKSDYNVYQEAYIDQESYSIRTTEEQKDVVPDIIINQGSSESILEPLDRNAIKAEERMSKALSFNLGIQPIKDKSLISKQRRTNDLSSLLKLQTDKFPFRMQDAMVPSPEKLSNTSIMQSKIMFEKASTLKRTSENQSKAEQSRTGQEKGGETKEKRRRGNIAKLDQQSGPTSDMSQRLQMIVSINELHTKQLKSKMERLSLNHTQFRKNQLEEVNMAKESLTNVIYNLSKRYEKSLSDLQHIMDQSLSDNKLFKDTMLREYSDFFRNKHKIINNFQFFASQTKEAIEKFKREVEVHASKSSQYAEAMPLLFDVVNLTFRIQQEDLRQREVLWQRLDEQEEALALQRALIGIRHEKQYSTMGSAFQRSPTVVLHSKAEVVPQGSFFPVTFRVKRQEFEVKKMLKFQEETLERLGSMMTRKEMQPGQVQQMQNLKLSFELERSDFRELSMHSRNSKSIFKQSQVERRTHQILHLNHQRDLDLNLVDHRRTHRDSFSAADQPSLNYIISPKVNVNREGGGGGSNSSSNDNTFSSFRMVSPFRREEGAKTSHEALKLPGTTRNVKKANQYHRKILSSFIGQNEGQQRIKKRNIVNVSKLSDKERDLQFH